MKHSSLRTGWWWAAVPAAVLVAVVLVWFQPQKLWIDETAREALPSAGAPAERGEPAEPAEPTERTRGEFVSRDHATTGAARLLELADGSRVVRLEGLDTSNGPDLFVYLSPNPPDGAEGAFDDGPVNLGRLKANKGDQNYSVPRAANLDAIQSVVIWCDRFDSAFGAASFRPAG